MKLQTGGEWTKVLKYDLHGLLTDGYDARGVNTHFTYDGLKEDYFYDAEGRVSDYTLTLSSRPSNPLATSYIYDTLSRATDIRYPAQYGLGTSPRKVVQYSYDVASRLSQLKYDGQQQAGDIVYNAASQTTQLKVGVAGANQVTENYGYDNQTGLLANQTVQRGGSTLLSLSYDYRKTLDGTNNAKTGQLKKITNNLDSNRNREYSYDALGRLTTAKGGNNLWQQIYSYDRYGNKLSTTASGVAANGTPIPRDGHANLSYSNPTNRINSPGFEYDAMGNQTRALSPDGQSWLRYEYDAANRLVYVKTDAGTVLESYNYGATNARLIKRDGATNDLTYYAWAGAEVIAEYSELASQPNVVKWAKSYVSAGGRLVSTANLNAQQNGETIEHHHSDRLGSRIITNPTGGYFEQETLPFGTALNAESGGATNRRFTSYDRSNITGLDYAVNRHYDSGQSRFTQVDPIGMAATSLTNPQSLNLYAYVENDPTNFIDPLGLNMASPGTRYFSDPMGVAYYVDGMLSDARTAWGLLGAGAGFIDSHSFGGALSVIDQYTGGEHSYRYGQLIHFFNTSGGDNLPCPTSQTPENGPSISSTQAFNHYTGGSGNPLSLNIRELSASVPSLNSFPQIQNRINEGTNKPFEQVSIVRANSSPVVTSGDQAAFLGRIIFNATGVLNLYPSGDFQFYGSIGVNTDRYDFDKDTAKGNKRRTSIGQFSTGIGSILPGKPFNININGRFNVDVAGDRQGVGSSNCR